jgi:mono/diheme cytochrome c family protein
MESTLTDQEIADVLTFVRNSFGNKASMVTVAEVKALRAKLK